ncbi:MAG: helix-turn-helix transcriptional regulator [Dehalococcoidia bacterium]|nr:helix-turn-helix transcriptional regulator [Dehalococcoidia bacterium]
MRTPKPNDTLRRNVRSRLAALGMTQFDLAKKIRMSPSTISMVLRGHVKRTKAIERVAKALGATADELVGGTASGG